MTMTDPKKTTPPTNPDAVVPTYHPEVPMDFSKFVQDTMKREAARKLPQFNKEEFNPNREYMKRYYEGATGRLWIGKPRYR